MNKKERMFYMNQATDVELFVLIKYEDHEKMFYVMNNGEVQTQENGFTKTTDFDLKKLFAKIAKEIKIIERVEIERAKIDIDENYDFLFDLKPIDFY